MKFHVWEPVYEAILADLGFPREADERARDDLAELLAGSPTGALDSLDLTGATVAVAGGAAGLPDDLDAARAGDVIVATTRAATTLREAGLGIDLVVTDLDTSPETVRKCTREGVPVAVHAHGDNRDLLADVVPTLDTEAVIGTTQAEPRGPVVNHGGFTDGDRAAFLADHLGAERLTFPGWEFDDPSVSSTKRRKLAWAERLLSWLETRRDERFAVLDGRRDSIDTSALPVE